MTATAAARRVGGSTACPISAPRSKRRNLANAGSHRVHARVGGLKASDIKGEDGLR